MTKMKNFWRLLNCDHTRTTVMKNWMHILGDAFPCVKPLLYPDGTVSRYYPHPHNPDGRWLNVVHYPNGTIGAITKDMEFRIPLVEKDILYYALNMGRFRKVLAETLGLEQTVENVALEDRVMCLGQIEAFPSEKFPVYLVTWYDWNEYKCAICELLLGIKTPFVMLSGLPDWPNELLPFCKEHNVATFSLAEALEFRDKRFQPTEGWYQTIEAFRKTLKPDNMVAAPPFEFRKKGQAWVVRYEGKEVFLKDGNGPHYLSMLLKKPNKEIFAVTLHAIVAGQTPDKSARVGVADIVMDDQTQREIEDRLRELVVDIADAQKSGDHLVEQESQEEYNELLTFYQKNTGLCGQVRKEHDASAKIRQAVLKAIQRTIILIDDELPECAAHLEEAIVTGSKFNYIPMKTVPWVL